MEESQLVAAAPLLWVQPEVWWSGENFAEPAGARRANSNRDANTIRGDSESASR